MIIAGKCPPEKEELMETEERGFENIELYLEKRHLDNYEESMRNLKESSLDVVTVHTPHLPKRDKEYFLKADKMARELGAFLVFHSGQVSLQSVPEVKEWQLESEYGFEGHSGISAEGLKSLVIERGCNLVADVAHLYIGEEDVLDVLPDILEEDRVKVVHLCDSTKQDDGLGFGEGNLPMPEICRTIDDSNFDGVIVLEVMPEYQRDALEKWRGYTS